ncbi:RING-H2 finger protein ATL60-like [Chenopodium quinoa]|uniref:RING-H2 finger protein ATL60-like n=1 Tax=Chenopodium quinoa TaxID=63459 RepID=UPI000B79692F|nr:RING-H2 finger protein ATL60-like [Chenopodium quinoa]
MGNMDGASPVSMNDATANAAASISTQIMIATVVVLFFVIAFCFFLHMYVKCFWVRNNSEDPNVVSWRRQLAGQRRAAAVPAHRRGLDPAALKSLPVVVYNPKDFKGGLECAVCLSEVSEGEKARLLPKCNHGFHVECIDMWFHSHSTCPLCRDPVISTTSNSSYDDANHVLEVQDDDASYSSDSNSGSDDGTYDTPRAADAPNFPTNVLFWGDETRVGAFGQAANAAASSSASSSGVSTRPRMDEMVIDIPSREFCEDCLSEAKTPVMTRLRSLRRLLSMGQGNKVAPSNCEVDQQA